MATAMLLGGLALVWQGLVIDVVWPYRARGLAMLALVLASMVIAR